MNKTHISFVILLTATVAALAIPVSRFTNWQDLIEKSPDVFIVKCITTLDINTTKPTLITDGMINSEIEVVSVLKGDAKTGLTHLASQYWPNPGERYLIFANYLNADHVAFGYNAIESYRVIPLNRYFRTNDLNGKTLNEKIQVIMTNRLRDLNDEVARDNEEKQRIEAGLDKAKINEAPSTNASPKAPKNIPSNGVKSF